MGQGVPTRRDELTDETAQDPIAALTPRWDQECAGDRRPFSLNDEEFIMKRWMAQPAAMALLLTLLGQARAGSIIQLTSPAQLNPADTTAI